MWQQVKPFNQSTAGKTKNMCLANVRSGYGIKNILPDAWTAWQNTEQHKGTPPAGVDVPIFFSYTATIDGQRKNWGHIGVQLKNGKFWSDGVTYANIAAYTANHSPVYVGWGESVNNERVIKENDMPSLAKEVDVKRLYLGMLDRAPSQQEIKANINTELSALIGGIMDSPERLKNASNQRTLDQTLITKLWAGYVDEYPTPDSVLKHWTGKPAIEFVQYLEKLKAHENLKTKARDYDRLKNESTPSDPNSVTISKDGLWAVITNLFKKG